MPNLIRFDPKAGIGAWMDFYNQERPHQALDTRTPAEVYPTSGPGICGRSASPNGCAAPGSLRNPGTCSPATTSPQAKQQQAFDSDEGVIDPQEPLASVPDTDMPAHHQGSAGLT